MSAAKKVVIFGGSGFVGTRVRQLWRDRFDVVAPTHTQVDVLDDAALATFLSQTAAPVVLNLAAGAQVDASEQEVGDMQGTVYALNTQFPEKLASLCGELDRYLVHVSTDYVFDGTSTERPYREADTPNPLSWYGETKWLGEQAVLNSGARACVARIEMPFSAQPHTRTDFARTCASRLAVGEQIVGVIDQRITPVFLDDAADALGCMLEARPPGIVHVAAAGWTTPYEFARAIAGRLGFEESLVRPELFDTFVNSRPARRPQHSWLDVSRFEDMFGTAILRPVEAELDAWVDQLLQIVAA